MHPSIASVLNEYFDYDQIFDLARYDANMAKLYHELKKLQKPAYEPRYRFVFSYYDTDYFVSHDQPGLTLRNLQRLTKSLDISNYFCLIITQQDISSQLETLRLQETNDACAIASITHGLQPLIHFDTANVEINQELIDQHYICLNGVRRFHRTMLYAQLQHRKILDRGLVSYMDFANSKIKIHKHDQVLAERGTLSVPNDLTFVYTDKFTRINDGWVIKDADTLQMLQQTDYSNYKNFNDTHNRHGLGLDLAQQAFLYVISETVFDHPTFVFAEKSMKPIASKRPFVLVSTPGGLKHLQKLGFKTFNDFWDEEYDNIIDPTQRIKALADIIEDISNRSLSELQAMCIKMSDILEYNFDYYRKHFYNNEVKKFKLACCVNQGPRT